jgi:hypothetical protein
MNPRYLKAAAALALLAGGALASAGCGASASPSVAQAAQTTAAATTTSQPSSQTASPAAYSQCMRRNGVPNFPDPDGQGRLLIKGGVKNGHPFGIDPNSPQFRKAQQACQKLAPKGGKVSAGQQAADLKALLKFAACMRSHGVPKFPDPQSAGGGVLMKMQPGSGLDPASPVFQAAQKACQKLAPGMFRAGPAPGRKP